MFEKTHTATTSIKPSFSHLIHWITTYRLSFVLGALLAGAVLYICFTTIFSRNNFHDTKNGFKLQRSGIDESDNPVASLSASSSSAPEGTIWVSVVGAVVQPGIYQIPAELRLADVLLLAGGFTPEVDVKFIVEKLHLAAHLKDGETIFIPVISAITSDGSSIAQAFSELSSAEQTQQKGISINHASKTELMSINGIGEVRAEKIISNRPYSNTYQIVEKGVIGAELYKKIESELSL